MAVGRLNLRDIGDTHDCGNEANDIAGNGHNRVRRDDIRHAIERCPAVGA